MKNLAEVRNIRESAGAACPCGAAADSTTKSKISGLVHWPELCVACKRERVEKYKKANLPVASWDWTIEAAAGSAREGFGEAMHWVYSREGLYIHGGVGTGKTVLSWCLLKKVLDQSRGGLFLSVPEFLGELRNRTALGRSWETRAAGVSVLVMDDIGAERPTEWVRECLLSIIDKRLNNYRPIIFTSNCGPGELYDHLGDKTGRIADRIVGSCRIVELKGVSFRKLAGRERMEG